MRTRYRWPELVPVKGESALPRAGEKRLRAYLEIYGQEIDERVRAVYALFLRLAEWNSDGRDRREERS